MLNGYRKLELRRFFQTCLILLLVDLLVFPPGLSAQTQVNWLGGTGNYGVAGNWDTGFLPDNGPFDVGINSGLTDNVSITVGGYSLNSMTIGGSGATNPSVVTVDSGNTGLTLSGVNPFSGDVLTIGNGGTLNIQNGSSALLDLSNGGTVTSFGTLNVKGGASLNINSFNSGPAPVITNNGTISIGDLSGAGTLALNDNGAQGVFTIGTAYSGNGQILLSDNSGNRISGASGLETLEIAGGTNLSGAGKIDVANFTNNGTLEASSINNSLIVSGNLTNWNGGSVLNGGQYIADSGATLQLNSLQSGLIQNIANANLVIGAGGLITSNGTAGGNVLSALGGITDGSVNVSGLGTVGTPFEITPTGPLFTMTSTDAGTSELTLDQNSHVVLNADFHNLVDHNIAFRGIPNTSTLNVLNGSTLTTGNFTNEASVNDQTSGGFFYDGLQRTAAVNVSGGSTLAVGALTTSTDNGSAVSEINIDGSHLAASSVIQGGGVAQGFDNQGGNSDINLTNHSTGIVTGNFQNNSDQNAATLNLDRSQMTVGGTFSQNQPNIAGPGGQSFLTLDHNSSMTVGNLTNSTGVFDDGTPQSHVSVNNGSSLTVTGTFNNVSGHALNGGDYYVGLNSSFNYTGDAITTIGSGTSVTLDYDGAVNNGTGSNALTNSLTTNNGSLAILNGASLNLTTLTNVDSNGVLSGGNFEVGNGSTLQYGGGDIARINTRLTLDGTGKLVSSSGQPDALSTSLNTVTSDGTLALQNHATLALAASAGSFNNNGTVRILSDSTLDVAATAFSNVSGGILSGNFEIGNGSTLRYSGDDIGAIGSAANLTLGGTGKFMSSQGGDHESLGSSLTNIDGTLTLNGAALTLGRHVFNAGTINANSGTSVLDISATSRFTNSPGPVTGGVINVNDGAALTFRDVSGSGFTKIDNSNGTINVLGNNSVSTLAFDSGGNNQKFLLSGGGTLHMQDSDSDAVSSNNLITGASGKETLINGYNHTIQGSGTFSNFAAFKNDGLIYADGFQGLTLDLTSGGTFTNTHRGEVDVLSDNYMTISSNTSTSITNNGAINLVGEDCGCAATLYLNDNGNGATFTLTGSGVLNMQATSNNAILGFGPESGIDSDEPPFPTANLINDTNHTIEGAGLILVNDFTNNGTLRATVAAQPLLVLSNLKNFDTGTGTLSGGTWIVDDQSALALSLYGSLELTASTAQSASSHDAPPGQIIALSGANVTLNGNGFITGDFSSDALGSLSLIDSGDTGIASLTLNGVGSDGAYTITPDNSLLTVSSDDTRNHASDSSTLHLDGTSLVLASNTSDSGLADLTNTAVSTTGNKPTSTVSMVDGSFLTVGSVTNNANSTGAGVATASVTLDGESQLAVYGDLHNQATVTGPFTGNSTASILLTNGSSLSVTGSVTNSVSSDAAGGTVSAALTVDNGSLTVSGDFNNTTSAANGNAYVSLTGGTIAEVDGTFTNSAGSALSLVGTGDPSALTTLGTGNFTNGGQVTLSDGAQLNNGGIFDNSNGTISLAGGAASNLLYSNGFTNTNGRLNVAAGDIADFRDATGNYPAAFTNLVTSGVTGQTTLNSGTYNIGGEVDYDAANGLINTIASGVSITLDAQNGGAAQILAIDQNSGAVNALSNMIRNAGALTLVNGVQLSTDTTGFAPEIGGGTLTNSGTITLGTQFTERVQGGVSTHTLIASPNSLNVTGAIFNTSDGIVNIYGAGDSVTATAQFTNQGQVHLTGSSASISAAGFDNQSQGTVALTGTASSINSTGAASNEGTMQFSASGTTVSSTGFTNSGNVTISAGDDVTFTNTDSSPGAYTQTGGTTTLDAGATLTAAEIDVNGGTLIAGSATIVGDVTVQDGGTIEAGDPQSISIIGTLAETQGGIMDLDLDSPGDSLIPETNTDIDRVFVTGNVTLGPDAELNLNLEGGDNFEAALGQQFDILHWTAGEVGDFDPFTLNGSSTQTFDHGQETFIESFIRNLDGSGELDLIVSGTSATPEPSTLAMIFGAMMLGVGVTWRRRRRTAKGID